MNKDTEQRAVAVLPIIETDEQMNRHYIPLPGGWEIQTQGKGSTFRIAHVASCERYLVLQSEGRLQDALEQMGRDVHAAHQTALAAIESQSITITRLERELAERNKDAERLDYLIANEQQVWEVNGRFSICDVTERTLAANEYGSAREAIDAAITATQQGQLPTREGEK